MHLVRPAVLLLALLSCTADDRVGPSRPLAPQAAIQATAALPVVRISEIHYDNTGTDADERIEISGPAGTDLTGWQLVLYNGSGGAVYNTRVLSGTIPATCDPRGVVVLTYPVNGIQNGAPDGIALVDAGGGVVEFLSYEGAFVGVGGPANGMMSTDIGASQSGSEPLGSSLRRDGAGSGVRALRSEPIRSARATTTRSLPPRRRLPRFLRPGSRSCTTTTLAPTSSSRSKSRARRERISAAGASFCTTAAPARPTTRAH